jgi:hypothetical protein
MNRFEYSRRGFLVNHPNTSFQNAFETTHEYALQYLSDIDEKLASLQNFSCFIFGMGAQPKSVYLEIASTNGVTLLASKSLLTGVFKLLSPLIASYQGLVKVDSRGVLRTVGDKLMNQAMMGVIIVDSDFGKQIEEAFFQLVSSTPNLDLGLKNDPSYFAFFVDSDNNESSTGIVGITSYGYKSPQVLVELAQKSK